MRERLYFSFIRLGYILAYLPVRGLATILYRFQVKGRHHIPEDKNLLVVARHKSYLDPPLIGLAMGIKNMIHFIARKGLLNNPLFALPVKLFSTAINRDDFNKKDMKKILEALKRHETVCILPEGTTEKEAVDPKTGAIKFAERTGKKLLPIRFSGENFPPRFPNLFPKIVANIGRPFGIEELEKRFDEKVRSSENRYQKLSREMMKKIDNTGS